MVVDRLLKKVPNKYLGNLHQVIIINSKNLNHKYRRKKVKSGNNTYRYKDCRGFYYQEWKGRPAYIELIIDNILLNWPIVLVKIPFIYDNLIAETLYHELGHHIHKYHEPIFKEKENVAEAWSKRLSNYYLRRRYWYLSVIFFIPFKIFQLSRFIINKIKKLHNNGINSDR